jgi:predicted NAD/FAD-dependent oxidoreductase
MSSEGYDKNKDKILGKFFSKTDKRYLNVIAYSYDGGENKIRIVPASKNTNPNADSNKQWIQQKGISGITKQEAKDLVIALERAIDKLS